MAGGSGDPLWMDVDRPEETSIVVRGLNASTRYLFRVRASVQGLGDWSKTVEASTLGNSERIGPRSPSLLLPPWPQPSLPGTSDSDSSGLTIHHPALGEEPHLGPCFPVTQVTSPCLTSGTERSNLSLGLGWGYPW